MQGPDSRLVAWNRALTADMIATQPVVQDLPRLEKTTLFLIGQLDRTGGKDYPALARSAYRKSPNATLIPLPKAGHLPMVDAFGDYIREVLRFFGEI